MSVLCVECDHPQEMERYQKAGADELIFALKDCAFTSIGSFETDEIKEFIQKGHKLGIRTTVLMNRLFPQKEIENAAGQMLELIESGADGVMFADPGLMKTAVQTNHQDKMIYRPETLMTDSRDGQWWMEQGLQSVVISPLLTKEEIITIGKNVKNTTLPVHGHMMMSVSRRQLLNSYGEKQNVEGLHSKRNLFLKEEKREGLMPVYEDDHSTMIFTDYILQSFAYMKEFVEAGIHRFEIEADVLDENDVIEAVQNYAGVLAGKMPDLRTYSEEIYSEGYLGEKTVK